MKKKKTLSMKEYEEEVKKKNINPQEYAESFRKEAETINKKHHFITTFCNINSKSPGIPVTVKDCICVKNVETRSSSAILNSYMPVFHATCIEKSLNAGSTILGKTVQDEFGFGGFSVNVGKGFDIPRNPHDDSRVCGGSSGGSAGITASTTHAHYSIAESTGGSIEAPASYCGVVGICPTYGRVSRYGLLDYANSLDKIGVMTKTVEDSAKALTIISGRDEKDPTSSHEKVPNYISFIGKSIKGMRIGYLDPDGVEEPIRENLHTTIKILESLGATTKKISLSINDEYVIPSYYILALTEASTNLAKYCGLRYGAQEDPKGYYNEYFTNIRSTHFGKEAKRRILLGTFARQTGFRDAYYIKALQARTHIINEYKKMFATYNAILSPTMPLMSPLITKAQDLTPLQSYLADALTVGPNLAGLPHISVPTGTSKGLPIGLMLTSNHFEEGKMLQIASAIEGGNK